MSSALANIEVLIDRIYEAAVFPDRWTEAMDRLAHVAEAGLATLHVTESDQWQGRWAGYVTNRDATAAFAAYAASDVPARTKATPALIALDRQGFASPSEVFSSDEWAADPLVSEWARKWGFGEACAATFIQSPSGEIMVVHVHRTRGAPGFGRRGLDLLDSLRPHLARAALLATRWRLERLRIAAEALAVLGLPALIIDRNGRVLAANKHIEGLRGCLKWLPKDRIEFVNAAANSLFRIGLAQLANPASSSVRSFAVRTSPDEIPLVAHLVPTAGQARDLFDGALGVLLITPVTAPAAPDAALIRGLFDLSPNEARVARAITQGLTMDEIATRDGVGRETVRSQVKAVLAKTGTRRQAEVASLLRGLPKFPVVDGS